METDLDDGRVAPVRNLDLLAPSRNPRSRAGVPRLQLSDFLASSAACLAVQILPDERGQIRGEFPNCVTRAVREAPVGASANRRWCAPLILAPHAFIWGQVARNKVVAIFVFDVSVMELERGFL